MAQKQDQGGLSVQTLIIASLASLTAAIVVHEVWEGGAILGAAITPVIVALTSEALKKPAQAVTSIREDRVTRTREPRPASPPPPTLERPDPFGIWQDGNRSWRDRLTGRHLRIALITGLIAFLIGAVALTGTELVFGGNVGGGSDRITILPGKQRKSGDRERDRQRTPTTEQPGQATPAPAQTAPEATPPTTTTPPTPTTPPQGAAPPTGEAPAEPAPEAPAPGEEAPAPTP